MPLSARYFDPLGRSLTVHLAKSGTLAQPCLVPMSHLLILFIAADDAPVTTAAIAFGRHAAAVAASIGAALPNPAAPTAPLIAAGSWSGRPLVSPLHEAQPQPLAPRMPPTLPRFSMLGPCRSQPSPPVRLLPPPTPTSLFSLLALHDHPPPLGRRKILGGLCSGSGGSAGGGSGGASAGAGGPVSPLRLVTVPSAPPGR
ncbi:hypothetical protein I4F81_005159 [Pyropia yezoensis]|uniref:Uncharacterized protein n=1 Tax=Pyropia yezoensis TaxID=2788 RepID=A0ACC3BX10_PYRYE|nr:hypothetical protein I4F81_005159 [Neopyropia yezoensis]